MLPQNNIMPTRNIQLTQILNPRQMNFVHYWKGDAVEAARAAGYSDPKSAAFNLMQHEVICELIRKKQTALAEESGKTIARQLSFYRSDVINRLWELANMSPTQTGETITGQIRAAQALAEILSVGSHLENDNQALVKELEESRSPGILPSAANQEASPAPELPSPQPAPQFEVASNEIHYQ